VDSSAELRNFIMGLSESLVFYVVLGVAVSAAVWLSADSAERGQRIFQTLSSVLFWPLYVPVLLSRPTGVEVSPPAPRPPADEMAAAIAQVEVELDTALSSLDGWAENVLAREKDRLCELRGALAAEAQRIREMDVLIARTAIGQQVEALMGPTAGTTQPNGDAAHCSSNGDAAGDRRRQSEQARRKNIARLREVRRQAHAGLMGTLAWVRELVSMIHLAKFTGAPAARAEELVAQIAAAVEGISAVTWQEEPARAEGHRPLQHHLGGRTDATLATR
jgi:hypothetical protein